MTIEAGIHGPILEEAKKARLRQASIEEGRKIVPDIHQKLTQLFDENVLRNNDGEQIHFYRGWSAITVYLKPDEDGDKTIIYVLRHVSAGDLHVNVFDLDTNIRIGAENIILKTKATVPQRQLAAYESMRIPTGSTTPGAPPFEQREATLEEVGYIGELIDVMSDPSQVERIGNRNRLK